MNKIVGLAHIGIPVKSAANSLSFYSRLGFREIFRADPAETGFPVIFVRCGDGPVLELYQIPEQACGAPGAVNHFALEVSDIEAAFAAARDAGLLPEGETIHSMPVFENGVRFFMIDGPDGERIEFNRRL